LVLVYTYGYVELIGEGEERRLVIRGVGGGRRLTHGARVVLVPLVSGRGRGGEEVVGTGAGAGGEVEKIVHAHGVAAHGRHPVVMVVVVVRRGVAGGAAVVAAHGRGGDAGGVVVVVRAHSHAELHPHGGHFPLRRHRANSKR